MVVGYNPGQLDDPEVLKTMAHELFHEWLGNGFVRVNNPESVWFQEGFTDYLALWHLAHCRQITHQQFVDRIWELEKSLLDNPSKGTISFGDSDVEWRDGDGPNEQMAYRGAALLAFCTDLELRKAGHPGLSHMISELAKKETSVGNAEIREWYKANGLLEFHEQFVAQPNFVNVDAALKAIGCELTDLATPVAYAGFTNDNDGLFGKVSGVDPKGPAAKAGIKVGDQIQGFWPSVKRKVKIKESLKPEFNYGLSNFPIDTGVNFEVQRDGEQIRLNFVPTTLKDIATRTGYKASAKIEPFLRH